MSYFDLLFLASDMSLAMWQGYAPTAAPATPKLQVVSSRPQCHYLRPLAREEASHRVVDLDLVRMHARRR